MENAMTVSGVVGNMLAWSGSATTPLERWAAARRLSSGGGSHEASYYWFLALAIVALIFLLGLFWRTSRRQKTPVKSLSRELFAEQALRRGLSARERQILLAIVMRSGLMRSHDIFTTVDAFDRGAAKLLAECLQTRTTDEIERLKTEVEHLREKLGFQVQRTGSGIQSRKTSSRDIPAGSVLHLTRRRDRIGLTIMGRVIRNDDIELAVDLEEAIETHSSDAWRVRYSFGPSVWEFDTTAAGCDGTRLVLNHCQYVRFVNRRRFPRVCVNVPALVAKFPFVRRPVTSIHEHGDDAIFNAPEFVPAVVTELAGPGLRIESPLEIRAGDRILVALQLSHVDSEERNGGRAEDDVCVIESLAQVRHWRSTGQGLSIAVELIGLTDTEVDTLVRITNQAVSRVTDERTEGNLLTPTRDVGIASNHSVVGQEV